MLQQQRHQDQKRIEEFSGQLQVLRRQLQEARETIAAQLKLSRRMQSAVDELNETVLRKEATIELQRQSIAELQADAELKDNEIRKNQQCLRRLRKLSGRTVAEWQEVGRLVLPAVPQQATADEAQADPDPRVGSQDGELEEAATDHAQRENQQGTQDAASSTE